MAAAGSPCASQGLPAGFVHDRTFDALATDYDGTLAHDGVVEESTLDALRRAREGGLRLLMVTGRQVSDLLTTFAQPRLFDSVIAENGAVLYDPSNESLRVVGSAAPPALLARLAGNNVPISVGHSIVATGEAYGHQVRDAIRELGLDWHVIFNKGSVMALPSDVSKATGLRAAISALHIAPERVVGIGDAENDHALLDTCGLAVAVANAVPSLKTMADVVTSGTCGAGVSEIIGRVLAGERFLDRRRLRDPRSATIARLRP